MLEAFIDAPLSYKGLTVFPVIAPGGPMLPYLLSPEIEGKGILTVRERGDSGTPMVLARNNSLHPLLVLSGEPLPGEHPGRLVARSFILGGKSVTQIPASAIERGGWTNPNQEAEITEWVNAFPAMKNQVGVLACLGGQILGLEAFGAPNLYQSLHRRLLIRFVKQALTHPDASGGNHSHLKRDAQRLVDCIETADRSEAKPMGKGEFWHLSGSVVGGELLDQGHLIHLSAGLASVGVSSEARVRD